MRNSPCNIRNALVFIKVSDYTPCDNCIHLGYVRHLSDDKLKSFCTYTGILERNPTELILSVTGNTSYCKDYYPTPDRDYYFNALTKITTVGVCI